MFTNGLYAAYFVYDVDADPRQEVPMVVAPSCLAAVREAFGEARIQCSVAVPSEDAETDRSCDMWRLVVLVDGRRLLVGRGAWPSRRVTTHQGVTDRLPAPVKEAMRRHWPVVPDA